MKNTYGLFLPAKGRRKTARPLSTKHAIHLILKAKNRILRARERTILDNWHKLGHKFGVRTYRVVVSADHIHSVIKIHSRNLYRKFITSLTGLLSQLLRVQWAALPATRIAQWGRDFERLLKYLKLNEWEALGLIAYQPKRTRNLPDWLTL